MVPSQYPKDRVLWLLADHDGKMERSRLRRCAGMKLADLNRILGELAREGLIRISREAITLL
jgi:hypothetical protein